MSSILQIGDIEKKFEIARNKIGKKDGEKISEKYRGNKWRSVEPEPHLSQNLPFGPVAYGYCDSGRYLYIKKVLGRSDTTRNAAARIRGRIIHDNMMKFLDKARKQVETASNLKNLDMHKNLNRIKNALLLTIKKQLETDSVDPSLISKILDDCKKIFSYESIQISSRIHYFISRNDSITSSALIEHALPLVMNEEIRESQNMGFSEKITPDFRLSKERAIGDMKTYRTNPTDESYKIAMTGYALAYEKQYGEKIDLGFIFTCIVDTNRDTPFFDLDVFVIDDILRQNFIDQRNRMAQIVYEKKEPPLASSCPKSCAYLRYCNPPASQIVP